MMINSELNPEFSRLHREATQLKEAGDLDAAIEALVAAEAVMTEEQKDNDARSLLRRPLFLQAAGRGGEAIAVALKLLSGYPEPWGKKPKFNKRGTCTSRISDASRALVYDKLRLICQRDRKLEKALIYGVLAKTYTPRCELWILSALDEKWAGQPKPAELSHQEAREAGLTTKEWSKAAWEATQWREYQEMSSQRERWSQLDLNLEKPLKKLKRLESASDLAKYLNRLLHDFSRTDAVVAKEVTELIGVSFDQETPTDD